MIYRIEVTTRRGHPDPVALGIKKDIEDLGFKNRIDEVRIVSVYLIDGKISERQIRTICEDLLIDRITETYSFSGPVIADEARCFKTAEIAFNPGVMDPVEESTRQGILDLGIHGVSHIRTCKKYLLKGTLSRRQIAEISAKLLYNKLIQHVVTRPLREIVDPPSYRFALHRVVVRSADDKTLLRISKTRHLFLDLNEMRTIRAYFRKQKTDPTDCELETIAQTWSEHCKHKTMRGLIEFQGHVINNLLKQTVMKVTRELNKKWCVSVFEDNAGVIRFNDTHNVCFKVETHNHPSALEPYGGAGTGIGGVIRDPLGTGQSAKPIANTDVFCFAPPHYPHAQLPRGILHPKRILKGVVGGVRDYGNKMGIPTVNGAVLFDDSYLGNPLVFCGNVGILPRDKSFKRVDSGDLVILVGGRTGRDGIHGATFSSGELTEESETLSAPCVQIGNPITEKKMVEAILQARDKDLFKAITDCGGGGLSSAVGEIGEQTGIEVHLERVPLKYKGLSYTEIWISEAQERMILACHPDKVNDLKRIFEKEDVEFSIIGKFTNTRKLRLLYEGNEVANLSMDFLHNGLPRVCRKAVWKRPHLKEPSFAQPKNLAGELMGLLSNWNIASKEWIIRQYDHEVQGGSILKPLQGVDNDGPGDASIVRPFLDSYKGIILSCGINPDYGKIDPYWMTASAIDEALRQIVSVGGDIDRAALLDNFCWGNTNKPDRLGSLVRAAFACYDIAKGYGVPFISGKDSLNNEYRVGNQTISIPPTILISCIAVMDDIRSAISMDAKRPGSAVYVVGNTFDELGGSQYYKNHRHIGNAVPEVDTRYGKKVMTTLSAALKKGHALSCHDCSDGGIAVALAEVSFAGGLGIEAHLGNVPLGEAISRDDVILFSESNTRFIVEVDEKHCGAFEAALKGVPLGRVGTVTKNRVLTIAGLNGRCVLRSGIDTLKAAWKRPFTTI